MTRIVLLSVLALGCRHVELYPTTEVALEIDGETHDYVADLAQWEEEQGRVSVYLLPEPPPPYWRGCRRVVPVPVESYVNLRYYSGNPVAHFWLSHGGDSEVEKDKWECFVPGVLADGTDTLTWTKPSGDPRERTDTGEPDCHVTVTRDDTAITVEFDVSLGLERGGGGGHGGGGGEEAAEGDHEERVHARGTAVLTL